MTELDHLWTELHDLEGRMGRVENLLGAKQAAEEATRDAKAAASKRRSDLLNLALRAVPLVISLGSAALVALHLK